MDAGDFHARIDLAAPARGLHALTLAGRELPEAAVLGVVLPWPSEPEAVGLAEAYVRGGDLVAVYRSASLALEVDVCWQAVASVVPIAATALKLRVSVRGERGQSQPELALQSVLPCPQVWRLTSAADVHFVAGEQGTLRRDEGPGCLLGRLPAGERSYVEMVHPTSVGDTALERTGQGLVLRHRVFAAALEKGVMLRAWACGLFLPRAQDMFLAATAFTEFADTEPPLGA